MIELTQSQLDGNELNKRLASEGSWLCNLLHSQKLNVEDKVNVLSDTIQNYRDWKQSVRDVQQSLKTLHEHDPRKKK